MKKNILLVGSMVLVLFLISACGITKKTSDDSSSSDGNGAWIKYNITSTDKTLSCAVNGSFKDRDGVIKTFISLAPTMSVTYYQYSASSLSEMGFSAGNWTGSLGNAYIQVVNPSNATFNVYIINNDNIVASGTATTVGATVTVQYSPF